MTPRFGRVQLLRLLSSGVVAQSLLSFGSLLTSLLLIRHASNEEFGRFVLAQAALLLLVSLQGAFLGGPMAVLSAGKNQQQRASLLSTVRAGSRQFLLIFAAASALVIALLAASGMAFHLILVLITTLLAAVLNLRRELLRAFIQLSMRQQELPRSDALYVVVLLGITAAACYYTANPVPWVLTALALAAAAASAPLLRSLARNPGIDAATDPHHWADIFPLAIWATLGSFIYWSFSQGYNYLLAAKLSVVAVAAVASTRLLMMPVNLLTSSLNGMLMPMAAIWHAEGGTRALMRRLLPVVAGMLILLAAYCVVLWLLRHLVAEKLLHKQIADYDELLALWMLCVGLGLMRSLLQMALLVKKMFRLMAAFSLGAALVALMVMLPTLKAQGSAGAVIGLACGEAAYLMAVLLTIGLQYRASKVLASKSRASKA